MLMFQADVVEKAETVNLTSGDAHHDVESVSCSSRDTVPSANSDAFQLQRDTVSWTSVRAFDL